MVRVWLLTVVAGFCLDAGATLIHMPYKPVAPGECSFSDNSPLPASCSSPNNSPNAGYNYLACMAAKKRNLGDFFNFYFGSGSAVGNATGYLCPLSDTQVKDIATRCGNAGAGKEISCAITSLQGSLTGTGSLCRNYSQCLQFIFHEMGYPSGVSMGGTLTDSHAWNLIYTQDSADKCSTTIIDALNSLMYTCGTCPTPPPTNLAPAPIRGIQTHFCYANKKQLDYAGAASTCSAPVYVLPTAAQLMADANSLALPSGCIWSSTASSQPDRTLAYTPGVGIQAVSNSSSCYAICYKPTCAAVSAVACRADGSAGITLSWYYNGPAVTSFDVSYEGPTESGALDSLPVSARSYSTNTTAVSIVAGQKVKFVVTATGGGSASEELEVTAPTCPVLTPTPTPQATSSPTITPTPTRTPTLRPTPNAPGGESVLSSCASDGPRIQISWNYTAPPPVDGFYITGKNKFTGQNFVLVRDLSSATTEYTYTTNYPPGDQVAFYIAAYVTQPDGSISSNFTAGTVVTVPSCATPTSTPTSTPTLTPTSTPQATLAPTATKTPSFTFAPTATTTPQSTSTPTLTPTSTPQSTLAPTATGTPFSTFVPTVTGTP